MHQVEKSVDISRTQMEWKELALTQVDGDVRDPGNNTC